MFRALGVSVLAWLPMVSGCTSAQLQSQSTSYVIIDAMSASSGARPQEFSGSLASDVVTKVNGAPTPFEDAGRVAMHLAMQDPGLTPSSTNTITFTQYHVNYKRADGRNSPGVDVPYDFDGGLTVSVGASGAAVATFVLVRVQAKEEAPLRALQGAGGAGTISTVATVTFYGTDQAGRAVTVTANISINFSDWPDPA